MEDLRPHARILEKERIEKWKTYLRHRDKLVTQLSEGAFETYEESTLHDHSVQQQCCGDEP